MQVDANRGAGMTTLCRHVRNPHQYYIIAHLSKVVNYAPEGERAQGPEVPFLDFVR
jgi:hypothetical protein